MIKIFDANDREFSTAGNIIVEPIKCREFKKKSLNGWYIEVEVPIKYKNYIEEDKLCVIKTKSKLNPQAFRITDNLTYTNRKITFTANHVMFDAKNYFLVDVRPTNLNGINTLNYINQRTDEISPFKMFSNVENVDTAYFIRKNLLEAWATIEERWNGVFDADNWNISFLQKVGHDNGESIIYAKNMQSMKIFEDWTNVVTKLYPIGYNGLMLPEKFIESDIKYEVPYTRTVDFQTDLEQEEQTEKNLINELRNKAQQYMEDNKYPKVSYSTTSNINNDVEIGDIIQVLHPLVNIKTEVLEYEYDEISKKVKSITFGNYTRDVKTKFDNIKKSITTLNETLSNQMSVIQKQTDLINSLNKNGYVYIDENEILILDQIPKEQAKNVWRFGLGGIGFSPNGYEGPFEIAMTMDGQINAKFITTGTMSVSRIEGLANKISEYDSSIAEITINLGNITQSVSETKKELSDNYYTIEQTDSRITEKADSITSEVSKNIATAKQDAINSANASTDNKLKNYSTTEQMNSKIEQTAENITSEVSKKYSTKDETNNAKQEAINSANNSTDNKLKNYAKTVDMNSKIEQTAENITTNVNQTITEAKQDAIDSANNSTDNKLKDYTKTVDMNSKIEQTANSITTEVNENISTAKEEAIDSANTSINNKLKDYSTTKQMNSAITQKANEISAEVSKKVGNDEFATKLQQDWQSVQIAWNQISEYIQFINAQLQIKDGDKNILMLLDRYGESFYKNGKHIGTIGIGQMKENNNQKGLVFDLNTDGNYVGWASKDDESDTSYILKLTYAKSGTEGFGAGGLFLGTNLLTNGWGIILNKTGRIAIGGSGSNPEFASIFRKDTNKILMEFTTVGSTNLFTNLDMKNYGILNVSNVPTSTNVKSLTLVPDEQYIQFTNRDGTSYGATIFASDGRLKSNIKNTDIKAMDIIKQIKHRQFDWKKTGKHQEIGYIAQELKNIKEDFTYEIEQTNGEKTLQVNETKIIPYLSKAIQEQQEEIQDLKLQIKKQQEIINKLLEFNNITMPNSDKNNKLPEIAIEEKEEILDYGDIELPNNPIPEPEEPPKVDTQGVIHKFYMEEASK